MALYPDPRQAQVARPVSLGSQTRAMRGMRIQPDRLRVLTIVSAPGAGKATPTQRRCGWDPGGGRSSDSATGPRRQHRAGRSAAVSARPDCHLFAANGESSRSGRPLPPSFQPVRGRGGNSDALSTAALQGLPAPALVTRLSFEAITATTEKPQLCSLHEFGSREKAAVLLVPPNIFISKGLPSEVAKTE